ncbi:hypothetical protein JEM57_11805 [Escherichia albertii]|uniref:hypothetical protein n=1 Tax=Escherichia albertii TaxID=208962 RepID=UPI001F44EFF2|nr:hypothetical protein [Escherichia albertii]EHX2144027.1 hypothetical protein [Escherichia albertii]MCE7721367.1 hypothetical protein [Escherichia albertii]MCE7725190.1 hypothetical protein [Escherichia albertii]
MKTDFLVSLLLFIIISLFSACANSGGSGYNIIFIDLSDGLGMKTLQEYKNFLKEYSTHFDDENVDCWKNRIGLGFDSIKTDDLDDKYFSRDHILSVLAKRNGALAKTQEAMANTKMDFGYGGLTFLGADGLYVFQKINESVILYGVPLKGGGIVLTKLHWNSEYIIPVNVFDNLMCKAALSMDSYFAP